MGTKHSSPATQASQDIVITRILHAPRDLVWQAWTEPHHVAKWWGPQGFITSVEELDAQPGGTWRYLMIGPDCTEYPIKGLTTP